MMNNWHLVASVAITALAIGPFNYFGSGLTQISSASHRCTVDSLRMFSVWGISVGSGWEDFRPDQFYGYIVMLIGTLIYNEVNFNKKDCFNQYRGLYIETSASNIFFSSWELFDSETTS